MDLESGLPAFSGRAQPGTSARHHPGIVIAIIPEPVIGMPRNTDRHRPESPSQTGLACRTRGLGLGCFLRRYSLSILVGLAVLLPCDWDSHFGCCLIG